MTPRIVAARRRANFVWLVGAITAFLAAVAVTVLGDRDDTHAAAVELEAQRIASAIDSAARSAHVQADGIAATPLVRAAITTDAATMADIARSEMRFSRNPGEVLEIYQLGGGAPVSLLRLPPTFARVAPMDGRATRLDPSGGGGLDAIAAAPIEPQTGDAGDARIRGQIVISVPVDLAGARNRLANTTRGATLRGIAAPLELVPAKAGGRALVVAVHPDAAWELPPLELAVTVPAPPAWIVPARYAAAGLGTVLLFLFLIGLRKP